MDRNQSQNLVRNAPASVYPQVAALPSSNPKRPPTLPGMTPRTHRPRAVITLGVLMLLPALAACGGDPTPGPTSAPDHAAVTADVPTATWTPSPVDVLAQLPPAAKERTAQGAEAVVRYYFDVMNALAQNPQPNGLSELCLPDVEACTAIQSHIDENMTNGLRFSGPVSQVRGIRAVLVDPESPTTAAVSCITSGLPRSLIKSDRSTRTSFPSDAPIYAVFDVVWHSDRWMIRSVEQYLASTPT